MTLGDQLITNCEVYLYSSFLRERNLGESIQLETCREAFEPSIMEVDHEIDNKRGIKRKSNLKESEQNDEFCYLKVSACNVKRLNRMKTALCIQGDDELVTHLLDAYQK